MNTKKNNFNKLAKAVIDAGDTAAEKQSTVSRNYKSDGSVLTETDTRLDAFLSEQILELFPDSRIISEENPAGSTASAQWTFTIDPIDGTDSYSQGMPGWCVAVGILDKDMIPSGAIIYAPLWGPEKGSFLSLFPGEKLHINGKELIPYNFESGTPPVSENQIQITAGSKIHRHFDYKNFEGKVRITGSAVINISSILLHSEISGTILTPCYIWDLAAAHSIIKAAGLKMEYLGSKEIDYKYLAGRKKAEDFIVAGYENTISKIKRTFIPLS